MAGGVARATGESFNRYAKGIAQIMRLLIPRIQAARTNHCP